MAMGMAHAVRSTPPVLRLLSPAMVGSQGGVTLMRRWKRRASGESGDDDALHAGSGDRPPASRRMFERKTSPGLPCLR